jgi:starch synthase (maltosyl-transferring)
LYLPPIHPIGKAFRKGPNNSLTAGDNDPGSPWAIGSEAGGHDAIHPDLGDEEDLAVAQPAADEESSFDDFDDEFDDDFEEEENDPDWDHPDDSAPEAPPPGKGGGRKK